MLNRYLLVKAKYWLVTYIRLDLLRIHSSVIQDCLYIVNSSLLDGFTLYCYYCIQKHELIRLRLSFFFNFKSKHLKVKSIVVIDSQNCKSNKHVTS